MNDVIETPPAADPKLRNWFRDENGQPSVRHGVDLSIQPPIEQVIAELELKETPADYAVAFFTICRSYGIDLQLLWLPDDPADRDGLRIGRPFDSQVVLRAARVEALIASLERVPERWDELVNMLFAIGRYTDNRRPVGMA